MQIHYTRDQLANRWKCHKTTVDLRIKQGDLRYIEYRGKKVIHLEEILTVEALKPVIPRSKKFTRAKRKIELAENISLQFQSKHSTEPVKTKQPKTFLQKIYDFIFR